MWELGRSLPHPRLLLAEPAPGPRASPADCRPLPSQARDQTARGHWKRGAPRHHPAGRAALAGSLVPGPHAFAFCSLGPRVGFPARAGEGGESPKRHERQQYNKDKRAPRRAPLLRASLRWPGRLSLRIWRVGHRPRSPAQPYQRTRRQWVRPRTPVWALGGQQCPSQRDCPLSSSEALQGFSYLEKGLPVGSGTFFSVFRSLPLRLKTSSTLPSGGRLEFWAAGEKPSPHRSWFSQRSSST